jgi:hypothetical protein
MRSIEIIFTKDSDRQDNHDLSLVTYAICYLLSTFECDCDIFLHWPLELESADTGQIKVFAYFKSEGTYFMVDSAIIISFAIFIHGTSRPFNWNVSLDKTGKSQSNSPVSHWHLIK